VTEQSDLGYDCYSPTSDNGSRLRYHGRVGRGTGVGRGRGVTLGVTVGVGVKVGVGVGVGVIVGVAQGSSW
jgi:hypothetical protein